MRWSRRTRWFGDCPHCGHDWREHIAPDPCSECRYEREHGGSDTAPLCTATAPPAVPAERGRPRLILLCGLPGSGKTTLARRLADEVRAVRLRSDRDEKRLAARVLGAAVELHYLDVPTDVFEPPEPDELALFDAPPRRNANPRPGEVR